MPGGRSRTRGGEEQGKNTKEFDDVFPSSYDAMRRVVDGHASKLALTPKGKRIFSDVDGLMAAVKAKDALGIWKSQCVIVILNVEHVPGKARRALARRPSAQWRHWRAVR